MRTIWNFNTAGQIVFGRDDLSAMAEKTFSVKRILRVNPRQVTLEDVTSILKSAL